MKIIAYPNKILTISAIKNCFPYLSLREIKEKVETGETFSFDLTLYFDLLSCRSKVILDENDAEISLEDVNYVIDNTVSKIDKLYSRITECLKWLNSEDLREK